MYHQSKLLLFSISVTAILTFLSVSLVFETRTAVAQAGVAPAESPSPQVNTPPKSLEQRISELEKKVEIRPKDTWDKLGAISGLISGILIAVIGAFVTVIFKRRETALLEAQSKREDEDRKAKLELEKLGNERSETQLEIERQTKEKEIAISEREIAISQAQTVQTLLPSLQSKDQKTKETALMLIAFLGNPDLAAKLSSLYQTDLTPTLQAIASMPGLKLEQQRQAAAALGHFGHPEEAANKLLELSSQPRATTEERIVIANELETLGDIAKAVKVQLELAMDPQVDSEKRRDAVETLKRLEHTEQVKEELLHTAHNNEVKSSKRLAAIEALWQLDETQKAGEEWVEILKQLTRSPEMEPKELGAVINALRGLGQPEKATEVLKEIASDSGVKAKLRLEAATDNWHQGYKEEALQVFREIADSQEATFTDRTQAADLLEKLGSPEEGKEKKQKILREVTSKWWETAKNVFRWKRASDQPDA